VKTPHEAIPILRVADALSSLGWYSRLGFVEDWRHQHEPGFPWFVSVSSPDGATLFLTEHADDASGPAAVFLVTRDVDAIATALQVQVNLMPWGDRECETVDPDGNKIRISQPAESEN
jgi:catechol 2,3-dioxygenase-like lactoylglutathione lyase family enzyme